MPHTTTCLKSVVRNVSGSTKTFSFLPPHGKTLVNGGEVAYRGDVIDAIRHGKGTEANRYLTAFFAAIAAGTLEIKKNPNPILFDDIQDVTRMLIADGDVAKTDLPSWAGTSDRAEVLTPQI